MTEEKRKEKYGKNTPKYYQRVIDSLKASFVDHLFAYNNLPDEYAEKIDFNMFYKEMMSFSLGKKWIDKAPDDVIKDNKLMLIGQLSPITKSTVAKQEISDFD